MSPPPLELIYNNNYKYEICIDEVGRGCLFGPAYICAVVLPRDGSFSLKDIKDSKKFSSKKKIKAVSDYIKENSLMYHIESVDSKLIDDINILKAVMRGMHQCIKNCIIKFQEKALLGSVIAKEDILCVIDGNYFQPYHFFDETTEQLTEISSVTIEQGDAKYAGIAAASIVAKVARDDYILDLCEKNPDLINKYGLNTNMGYGTKKHIDGLKEHGITEWHRKTFAPCKSISST
uniref:Ribonuclease HII n=1 Tax=viral metagenome TaxID=1070528 RepID=A0A6C0DPL4_9ZZZZ